ncbi:beta-N-acetylhexosaminidase [Phenylobacterium sp. J367]|uniref:beta-N-acetylhexosaminidase n=1 Tax=Phenylobacterium sp. J367 TaxID=2898435 RepID=UPI0021518EE6|nr:beta-N-acetylhexosaminidase [Phenylobacterium sp. J367]MCR5879905.1 beta-N-acetylhexosaminidase [Phenylobacterium sp. J367]
MTTSAAIFGCQGPALSPEEAAFFRDVQPWGFILFARNIDTPDQVRRLTASLREIVGRDDAPILIDQEGGRIARLVPPHWKLYPPGRAYGELPADQRREITWLGGRLIAHDLGAIGVNVDCVPVLDVPDPQGHEIIGDRAYGDTPEQVAELGRAASEGLMAGGVLPIVKHIPGHGRAKADSHFELPVVDTPFAELDARDFAPFRALKDMPMAMTAHVIYSDLDAEQSATTSKACFERVIRGAIGFEGLVMCDDLSMKALSGGLDERARAALAAGCDVVLHCNGDLGEMRQVMDGTGSLAGRAAERAAAALAPLRNPVAPFDAAEARARFDAAFGGRFS